MRTATMKPQRVLAASVAFGLLAAGCGSADLDAATATTDAPIITNADGHDDTTDDTTDDPAVTAEAGEPGVTATGGGDDVVSQLVDLSISDAFAGDNGDSSIETAVAAFNDAGLDFSPNGLAERLPASCSGLDTQAVSEIIGLEVRVEDFEGFLAASPGYLSCGLYTANPPNVAIAYVHIAPDLNGSDNWGSIGTLGGAFDIPGLGDVAVWSDGSRSDNMTNPSMRQIQVDQGGTQSLIQAEANDPQLALIGAWSIPKLILVLATINASLT